VAKSKGGTTIIIKKIVDGHAGHHGGSWKVAFADFMTAMMAFFLLLWLIAALKPQQKESLANVFKDVKKSESDMKQAVSATTFIPKDAKVGIPVHESLAAGPPEVRSGHDDQGTAGAEPGGSEQFRH
jgi:chemotaxis protein MotB